MSEPREERPPHDTNDPRGGAGTGGGPGTKAQADWAEYAAGKKTDQDGGEDKDADANEKDEA